jgi:hypothetical protein
MTYLEFIQLNDFDRLTLAEAIKATEYPVVDCTAWTWGDVKIAQDLLNGDVTFEDILKLVKIETMLTEFSEARLVLQYFAAIKTSIESITSIENMSMAYQPTAKEVTAAQEVGGFDVFGTYPQTLRLVGIVAQTVKEVEAMPYNDCFAALLYTSRLNDFQKLVTK